jgi:hypothetical protein
MMQIEDLRLGAALLRESLRIGESGSQRTYPSVFARDTVARGGRMTQALLGEFRVARRDF